MWIDLVHRHPIVYDSGGGDAAGFLLSNDMEIEAFSDAAAQQLQAESMCSWEACRRRARLEPPPPLAVTPAGTAKKAPPQSTEAERKQLEQGVREREKALNTLLLQLESDSPGLHQMLELKPIDLSSLRANLEEDQAVLQYLPTESRLYIHVVTKGSREVREVEVKREELRARARRAANRISGRRTGQLRGLVLEKLVEDKQPPLDDELAWLYQQLVRPIEGELTGMRVTYVVPVAELTYLPFGALIRQKAPKVEYAVERFAFGYVTSLYMLDLMMKNKPKGTGGAFVLAAPDGSLPGARDEAVRSQGSSRRALFTWGRRQPTRRSSRTVRSRRCSTSRRTACSTSCIPSGARSCSPTTFGSPFPTP